MSGLSGRYVAPDVFVGLQGGDLHNMSVPPRTTISYSTEPVFTSTMVSFRHWLLFRDFARGAFSGDGELVRLFGGRSKIKIQNWLGKQGVTLAAADEAAAGLGGVLIGKGGSVRSLPIQTEGVVQRWSCLCDDLALTIGLLGRAVGNLFLSSRPPDYTWNALLGLYFIGDDPRLYGQKPPRKVIRAQLAYRK